MTPAIDLEDLTPEARKKLGLTTRRSSSARRMTADRMRGHALRVLAELHTLTQSDRARVLNHALKVNAVALLLALLVGCLDPNTAPRPVLRVCTTWRTDTLVAGADTVFVDSRVCR